MSCRCVSEFRLRVCSLRALLLAYGFSSVCRATREKGFSSACHTTQRERERERERERPVADELNLPQEMRNVQLFEAAEGGDYETVCSLLQLKANPQEHADGVGFTALLAASNQGHDKIVEILIAASVDIDYQTKTSGLPWIQHGATALMLASLFGHVKVVQVLLANKAR